MAWCESAASRSTHLRVCDVAPRVGMVFQDFEAQLFSTNVAHEVAFAMEQVGMDRAEMDRRIRPALEAVGLRGFEHRDPTSLSGGEKQRLAIASVLALRPSVIVLDEPTTDLDPEGRAEVFALIAKLRAARPEPDRDRARGRGAARRRPDNRSARGRSRRRWSAARSVGAHRTARRRAACVRPIWIARSSCSGSTRNQKTSTRLWKPS